MVDTNNIPSVDDMLNGVSIPSVSFANAKIGTSFEGEIIELGTAQVTDFATGAPKFWDDGKPQTQVVVTIATNERDPENPDDDGTRRVYLFGQKLTAARNAMKEAGIKKLETGFKFKITFSGEQPAKTKGFNPVKLYSVEITAVKSNKSVDAILADAGAKPVKSGEESAKLTAEQAAKVKKLDASGFNEDEIAETLGVNVYSVKAVLESDLI